jgi:lantibiotic modifying enzyme
MMLSYESMLEVAWQKQADHTSKYCPSFARAVRGDLHRTTLPLFRSTIAILSSWASQEITNPLEKLASISATTFDNFPVPASEHERARIVKCFQNRLNDVIESRMNGYTALAENLRTAAASPEAQFLNSDLVTQIESLGDPHEYGDCVRRLVTSSGRRFIYKPRNCSSDQILAASYAPSMTGSKTFISPIFSKLSYSIWEEASIAALESEPIRQKFARFGRSYGHALAISILLGLDDLHYENVLFLDDQSSVLIVDTETLLSCRLPANKDYGNLESICWVGLRTGLLPSPRYRHGEIADFSPIIRSIIKPQDQAVDDWKFCFPSGYISRHLTARYDAELHQSFFEAFVRGLNEARSELVELSKTVVTALIKSESRDYRYVIRPTRTYFEVLSQAISAEICLGREFQSELRRLLIPPELMGRGDENVADIVEYELDCLGRYEIPRFTTDHCGSLFGSSVRISSAWRADLQEAGSHSADASSNTAWEQLVTVASSSFRAFANAHRCATRQTETQWKPILEQSSALADIEYLSDLVLRNEIVGADGASVFIDFGPSGREAEYSTQFVGNGLYRVCTHLG